LRDPAMIGALAVCAQRGGAVGIRANGPEDITEVKARTSICVIGIQKVSVHGARPFITPSFVQTEELVRAGADVVALEATFENRPDAGELEDLVRKIREELGVAVMADVSTFEEGARAWESGADLVATTLSGYTAESLGRKTPDLDLVGRLAEAGVRAVLEGGVGEPGQVAAAFERGAWSVVVGTAITDPVEIAARFARGARS
jgi:N-acylglucosamine-6-phosphate 2-epimerase